MWNNINPHHTVALPLHNWFYLISATTQSWEIEPVHAYTCFCQILIKLERKQPIGSKLHDDSTKSQVNLYVN